MAHRIGSFAPYWKKFLRRVAFYFYLLGLPQSPNVSILWKKDWARSQTTKGVLGWILPWDLKNPGFILRRMGILPALPLLQDC